MIGRIVRPVDFERVLGTPSRARSAHFSVHHLAAAPAESKHKSALLGASAPGGVPELSTGQEAGSHRPVDEAPIDGCWLGMVVPKRHARRAVTRNLIKRQIRHLAGQALRVDPGSAACGMWVVRLRAPFDRKQFLSPASDLLRDVAGEELGAVLRQALRRIQGA